MPDALCVQNVTSTDTFGRRAEIRSARGLTVADQVIERRHLYKNREEPNHVDHCVDHAWPDRRFHR